MLGCATNREVLLLTTLPYFNGSVDLNIENVVKIYFFFGYLLAL